MLEDQQPEGNLEDAFNLLVSLARNAKLTYNEHMRVEKAVQLIHSALNQTVKTAPTIVQDLPPPPSKSKGMPKDSSSEDASQK